jgi:lipid-A-disaccharide synthase
MACSGSVSLELLYHTKPTAILYWVNPLTHFVLKWFFVKVKFITLVNLMALEDPFSDGLKPYDPEDPDAQKVLFPEYPTCRDKSGHIAEHVIQWLADEEVRLGLVARLTELKDKVGRSGASARSAQYIVSQLERRSSATPRPHYLAPAEADPARDVHRRAA